MLSIHESDWDTLDKSLQLKEAALDALRHFLEQGDTPEEIVERITGERPLKAFQPITTVEAEAILFLEAKKPFYGMRST